MVNLLDLEVSDEVLEKTAELEKRQQSIKNEIRVSRFGLDGNLGSLLVGREESWRGACVPHSPEPARLPTSLTGQLLKL